MSDSRRRSRGNQEEAAGPSNGLGGRNRPERPGGDMGDEDDIGAGPSGISEEEDDPTRRREIRSKYRDLINQVQRELKLASMIQFAVSVIKYRIVCILLCMLFCLQKIVRTC